MSHARRFLFVAATAVLALLMTASIASAQTDIEVFPEVQNEPTEDCGTVEIDVHDVTGGCHVELAGHIMFWAHTPAETPIMNCHWALEARLGRDGEGYVTDAVFTPSAEPPLTVGCTRAPCDEAAPSHALIPWPVHLREDPNAGVEEETVEMEFCIRTIASGEGGGQSRCEVHPRLTPKPLPLTHQYEVGSPTGHEFCEVSPPPFPVSITDHLETIGDEEIEIVHHDVS